MSADVRNIWTSSQRHQRRVQNLVLNIESIFFVFQSWNNGRPDDRLMTKAGSE